MQPTPHEEAQRWMAEALRDMDTAHYLADGKRFNTACFICQQCAEKALKAFLYAQGVETPSGHSVDTLIRDASSYDPSMAAIQDIGAVLDKYYIATRYPNGLPGGIPFKAYTSDDARQAMLATQRILDEVARRLK